MFWLFAGSGWSIAKVHNDAVIGPARTEAAWKVLPDGVNYPIHSEQEKKSHSASSSLSNIEPPH